MPETQVGVIGYGGIGEATARALSALGSRVAAFDVCGIRMAKAALDGFGHLSRDELIATSDVIVGVSGECSVGSADFELLRPGAFVASGSSKQVEIDLRALNERAQLIEDDGIVKEYELDGKPIILLNDGMPVNFLEQSVLGRVLDLVYTELYMCIRQLAVEEIEPGLARLPVGLQREIADVWRSLHWR
jgi:adenosylhomocysteinase